MAEDGSSWDRAVGAWVPLSDLPQTVERELGIGAKQAVGALRHPLESHQILTRIPDWRHPDPLSRSPEKAWVTRGNGIGDPYRVSEEGWKHVDWQAGTLAGCRVEVLWSHVVDALRWEGPEHSVNRPAPVASAPQPKPAMPPPGGWTPIQAAEALWPDLVEVCRAQENQREAFRRLSVSLTRAVLRERDDLLIAGRDLARGIDAPPVVVPRELYDDDTAPEGSWFTLDIWNATFELRMPPPGQIIVLRAVRIFAAKDMPPVAAPRPASGSPAAMAPGGAQGDRAGVPQALKSETAEAAEAVKASPALTTIAAERRLEAWLIALIRAAPCNPPGKSVVRRQAEGAGHRVSGAAFNRAWANAIKAAHAPAWRAPGRKSKSPIEKAT